MTAPPRALQTRVLTSRYLARMAGDYKTVVLLVAQAPFIGWLCTLTWGAVETDTPSLYFVLSLAAVWFGCINACREIVKDRPVIERERLYGLSMLSYVVSRYRVLAVLGLAQVVLLQLAVEWSINLRGPMLVQTAALWGASICGTGLGLLVSSISSTQERAVGVVPLLILPQILFSEVAIPREFFGRTLRILEMGMPVSWCYEIFQTGAALEPEWWRVPMDLAVLAGMAVLLSLAAVGALLPRREIG